jgi:hypothetical protein
VCSCVCVGVCVWCVCVGGLVCVCVVCVCVWGGVFQPYQPREKTQAGLWGFVSTFTITTTRKDKSRFAIFNRSYVAVSQCCIDIIIGIMYRPDLLVHPQRFFL